MQCPAVSTARGAIKIPLPMIPSSAERRHPIAVCSVGGMIVHPRSHGRLSAGACGGIGASGVGGTGVAQAARTSARAARRGWTARLFMQIFRRLAKLKIARLSKKETPALHGGRTGDTLSCGVSILPVGEQAHYYVDGNSDGCCEISTISHEPAVQAKVCVPVVESVSSYFFNSDQSTSFGITSKSLLYSLSVQS